MKKTREKRRVHRDISKRAYTEAYLSNHCGNDKASCLLYSRQKFDRLARQARMGARRAMGRPTCYDPVKNKYRFGIPDPCDSSEQLDSCY